MVVAGSFRPNGSPAGVLLLDVLDPDSQPEGAVAASNADLKGGPLGPEAVAPDANPLEEEGEGTTGLPNVLKYKLAAAEGGVSGGRTPKPENARAVAEGAAVAVESTLPNDPPPNPVKGL